MYLISVVISIWAVTVVFLVTDGKTDTATQSDPDKWYWGYADEDVPFLDTRLNVDNNTSNETSPTEIPLISDGKVKNDTNSTEVPEMCQPHHRLPGMPDFSKPGRRISEQKCFEYIWEINNRVLRQERRDFCVKYANWRPPVKVVGGKPVPPGVFPHMVAIGWKAVEGSWLFKCGGSLISDKFVLTAAHCRAKRDPAATDEVPKIVRIGDQTLRDNPNFFGNLRNVDRTILKIISHPRYAPPEKYYDIAIIELIEYVTFTRVAQPACLWTQKTSEVGMQANITGWGVVRSGSKRLSPTLQAATVDIFGIEQCDHLFNTSHNRNWEGFDDHQICAGKLEGGIDSCQGDSGGPLQVMIPIPKNISDKEGCMHYLIGIISFGVGCALPKLPGIYIRVSTFIDWIENIVWKT